MKNQIKLTFAVLSALAISVNSQAMVKAPSVEVEQQVPCENKSLILPHKQDNFKGIVIDIIKDASNFEQRLRASLNQWKQDGKRGVWLTIPIEHSELVPVAVKDFGFIYHHAKEDRIVLTKFLRENEKSTFPAYATRSIGVWNIVINEKNEILVVKEKYNKEWGYKFPTGAVDMAEDVPVAAVRETKEETGIATQFKGIVGWIERHHMRKDKGDFSDISFLCVLQPLNTEIILQESEVADVAWIAYDEFKKVAQGPQKAALEAYEEHKALFAASSCTDFANNSTSNMGNIYKAVDVRKEPTREIAPKDVL